VLRNSAVLFLFALAVLGAGSAAAQTGPAARDGGEAPSRQDNSDEVIVHGRRLGDLRLAVESARQRAYDIFNEINGDNDFDVHCGAEKRDFSHMKRRLCRPQFENRIQAQAAKEYMHELFVACRGEISASCVDSGAGQRGLVRAHAVEIQIPGKRKEMNQEILRLANENTQFAQAILDYYEASQELKAATKRRDE
jgi:hypothetical protein